MKLSGLPSEMIYLELAIPLLRWGRRSCEKLWYFWEVDLNNKSWKRKHRWHLIVHSSWAMHIFDHWDPGKLEVNKNCQRVQTEVEHSHREQWRCCMSSIECYRKVCLPDMSQWMQHGVWHITLFGTANTLWPTSAFESVWNTWLAIQPMFSTRKASGRGLRGNRRVEVGIIVTSPWFLKGIWNQFLKFPNWCTMTYRLWFHFNKLLNLGILSHRNRPFWRYITVIGQGDIKIIPSAAFPTLPWKGTD